MIGRGAFGEVRACSAICLMTSMTPLLTCTAHGGVSTTAPMLPPMSMHWNASTQHCHAVITQGEVCTGQ